MIQVIVLTNNVVQPAGKRMDYWIKLPRPPKGFGFRVQSLGVRVEGALVGHGLYGVHADFQVSMSFRDGGRFHLQTIVVFQVKLAKAYIILKPKPLNIKTHKSLYVTCY